MGAFLTPGVYALPLPWCSAGRHPDQLDRGGAGELSWEYWQTAEISPSEDSGYQDPVGLLKETKMTPIRRMLLESRDQLSQVLEEGTPVVFEGLTLGSCVAKWDAEYLTNTVGRGHKVRSPDQVCATPQHG